MSGAGAHSGMSREDHERFRQGSPELFRRLVAPHAVTLARFLLRYCPSEAEAEEVLQEALLKSFQRRSEYDPARPFRAWLYAIAVHCALDRARVDSGRTAILRREAPRLAPCPEGEFEEGQPIRELIQALPPDKRQVLILFYYEGFTYGEIAELLGVPLGTVKSRMSAALAQVRPIVFKATGYAM